MEMRIMRLQKVYRHSKKHNAAVLYFTDDVEAKIKLEFQMFDLYAATKEFGELKERKIIGKATLLCVFEKKSFN